MWKLCLHGRLGRQPNEVVRVSQKAYEPVAYLNTSRASESLRGFLTCCCCGAANRDPSHFEDPDEFRLDRRNGKCHISFVKGTQAGMRSAAAASAWALNTRAASLSRCSTESVLAVNSADRISPHSVTSVKL
jgi:hypothetical protein